jgi:sugar-specific transcriptional regulator TrmB
MRLSDAELLDDLHFSVYEKKALLALVDLGIADAGTLCREGDIPSSKIYRAMERLIEMGLAQIQPARPKLFASPPPDVVVDRLIELSREKAERFAAAAEKLRRGLSARPARLRGRPTVVDLALGHESHVRRHLTRLTAARMRILSYLEQGDLQAIDRAVSEGFPCCAGSAATPPSTTSSTASCSGSASRARRSSWSSCARTATSSATRPGSDTPASWGIPST